MLIVHGGHTWQAILAWLSALLLLGSLFACPIAALANDQTEGDAAPTYVDAKFFIAKLKDSSVKPNSEQEVKQNLSGYTSGVVVKEALKDPEGKVECFDQGGVTSHLAARPSDDEIRGVYSDFDPSKQTVLWYVIKHEDDGWHVDGLLLDKSALSEETDSDGKGPDEGGSGTDIPDESGNTTGKQDEKNPTAGNDGENNTPGTDDGNANNAGMPDAGDSSTDGSKTPAAQPAAPSPAKTGVGSLHIPVLPKMGNFDVSSPSPSSASTFPDGNSADSKDTENAASASSSKTSESALGRSAFAGTAASDPTETGASVSSVMHTIGLAGMCTLVMIILVGLLLSGMKTAAVKAAEEALKSGAGKSGGKR